MTRVTRRLLLQRSAMAGAALALPHLWLRGVQGAGPNSEVRLAVIGMGGINTVGGVGGRGRQLVERFRAAGGAKIVALCDVDQEILDHEVGKFTARGEKIAAYRDMRQVFDAKNIDAVAIATPNHWHALATIWACQAGKDVYVEKPFAYNIWEGQQMLAAARKYGRMVQVGTQRRASTVLPEVFDTLRGGTLGAIRCVHALIYRGREGIGKVTEPTSVPATIDYDLWCGPTAKTPVMRKQLHYDWHWVWPTGNGEIGNNGAHLIDIGRWALGQNAPPPRTMSIGGRFGVNDDGQTANVQIAWLDYQPAPLVCEIRNFRQGKSADALGKFHGATGGIIIVCEGGSFAGDMTGGAFYDRQEKKIKDFRDGRKLQDVEVRHATNFLAAVHSRKSDTLYAEAAVGQASATCCHIANTSHRLGKPASPDAIAAACSPRAELAEAFSRARTYLQNNGVDLNQTPATLGPWLTFDAATGRFSGEHAAQAQALAHREYRAPFTVPEAV